MKREYLKGNRYGRLVITEDLDPPSRNKLCRCDCGTEKEIRTSSLKSGDTKSCGCLQRELASNRLKTHGLSEHPLYNVFKDMHKRCFNENRGGYKHYGGRGISVCDRWNNSPDGLNNFIEDMHGTYKKDLELDREDNDGNYEPDNCRWLSRKGQNNNRRNNRDVEYNGEVKTLMEWSEHFNIDYKVLSDRIGKVGHSFEEAVTDFNPKPGPKVRGLDK